MISYAQCAGLVRHVCAGLDRHPGKSRWPGFVRNGFAVGLKTCDVNLDGFYGPLLALLGGWSRDHHERGA